MHRRTLLGALAGVAAAAPLAAMAARIGINPPFPPLTAERVDSLPAAQRQAWHAYLERSKAAMAADKAALRAERAGLAEIPADVLPVTAGDGMALDKPDDWYRSAEARVVTANILSFQTPAGGWSKNHPRNAPPRLRGQAYLQGKEPVRPAGYYDTHEPYWHYVGTTDNGATITEIRFLARVARVTGDEAAKAAAAKGLRYLLDAQFPNGGWPQVWPLEGGYHDGMTLNDNAMISVTSLVGDAGRGRDDFAVLPADLRARLQAAEQRALEAFVKSQVVVGGRPTLWAPQYDALTLAPCSARAFEPPSLSTTDSAALLLYLMEQPKPSAELRAAIAAGVAALRATALRDVDFTHVAAIDARRLVAKPGAGPIWGRYLDLKTLKPVFGTRDRAIHDSLDEVNLPGSGARGYRWYSTSPGKAINRFERWRPDHA